MKVLAKNIINFKFLNNYGGFMNDPYELSDLSKKNPLHLQGSLTSDRFAPLPLVEAARFK